MLDAGDARLFLKDDLIVTSDAILDAGPSVTLAGGKHARATDFRSAWARNFCRPPHIAVLEKICAMDRPERIGTASHG